MDQSELYIKYGQICKMVKGSALEDTPWLCVKCGKFRFTEHPSFIQPPSSYKFALAIKDDKPIFVGDTLYFSNGFKYIVSDKDPVSFLNTLSWTPTKGIDYKQGILKFYTSLVEYKQDLLRQGNHDEAMYVGNKIQGIIELMLTLQIEYKE